MSPGNSDHGSLKILNLSLRRLLRSRRKIRVLELAEFERDMDDPKWLER
jgi:hypothetical protein